MTWEFGRDLTKPGEDVYIRVFTLGPGQVPPPGFDQVISLNPERNCVL
jgi:hypothetical protein